MLFLRVIPESARSSTNKTLEWVEIECIQMHNLNANCDYDCADQCNGLALEDDCGICSGGLSEHEANSEKDCVGECFGDAQFDDCCI